MFLVAGLINAFNCLPSFVQWELLGSLGLQRVPQGDWHAEQPEGCLYSKWPQEGTITLFLSCANAALNAIGCIYFNFEYCNSLLLISSSKRLLCYPHLYISHLLLSFWPALTPGLGEQRPEQREDLPDLSDSESGQDGPERAEQQEVYSRPETAIWCGRYLWIN